MFLMVVYRTLVSGRGYTSHTSYSHVHTHVMTVQKFSFISCDNHLHISTGVFIRDLIFFNDGNAKKLKNGLINFSKLRTMVLKVNYCLCYQLLFQYFLHNVS